MKKTAPCGSSECNSAFAEMWKELERFKLRLDRADRRIDQLETRCGELEKERDKFRDLYYQALADNRVKDKKIAELERKLAAAEKQLAWFRKQQFGQKSEAHILKTEQAEEPDDEEIEQSNTKRKRGQQPGSKGHGRTNRDSIQTEEVFIELPDATCSKCLKPFARLSETDDCTVAEIETVVYKTVYKRYRYASRCLCAGAQIQTAPPVQKLYPKAEFKPQDKHAQNHSFGLCFVLPTAIYSNQAFTKNLC